MSNRYVHIGDTYLGMPSGGYRDNVFRVNGLCIEYFRDVARLIYGCINAYYMSEEVLCVERTFRSSVLYLRMLYPLQISSYRERGSIRTYFKDGWNFCDWILIICVWFLSAMDIMSITSSSG